MKVATLFLAAALGSASPVRTQNSMEVREEQNACDCSKPFQVSIQEVESCPEGYEDISLVWIPKCVQVRCSAADHKDKCAAKPQDATPTTMPQQPTTTTTALSEKKSCECSKPFEVFIQEVETCPEGYKDISPVWIPHCVQVGCSKEDHKAQCAVKPDAATPTTAVPQATTTTAALSEKKSCECSKPFETFVGELENCPDGYEDISPVWIPHCVQVGCSEEDHEAQCAAKPEVDTPTAVVEQPAPTDTKPLDVKPADVLEETAPADTKPQDAPAAEVPAPAVGETLQICDCSKPFETFVSELDNCPAGYRDISPVWIPHCVQIGCSAEEHKAKCDAKPETAKNVTKACN